MVTPNPRDPGTRYTKSPDSRIRDNRYRFARGSQVNVIAGPNAGRWKQVSKFCLGVNERAAETLSRELLMHDSSGCPEQ